MNFGGIDEPRYNSRGSARVLVLPVSYESTSSSAAMAIIEASQELELYEEETDAEVFRLGIHTLQEFLPRSTPEATMGAIYEHTKDLVESGQFICTLGGERAVSVPIIRAHAERYHDLSVFRIGARPCLHGSRGAPLNASVMATVVRDLLIPSVQIGVRSISADEARFLESGLPIRIFRAMDIVGRAHWLDEAVDAVTDAVYLSIDVSGLDPAIMPAARTPEPGGLGWYETLALIRKLAARKRIVGMDLVEYSHSESNDAAAFLCGKLIYKSLAYIFNSETPKIIGS